MTALAEKIGMSRRGLYSSIENKTISAEVLEKISLELDVPITVFFNATIVDTENEEALLNYKTTREGLNRCKAENNLHIERIKELQESLKDKKSIINLTFSHVLTALKLYNEFVNEVKPNYNELSALEQTFIESFENKIIDRLKLLIKSSDTLLNIYDLDSFLNVSIKPDEQNR